MQALRIVRRVQVIRAMTFVDYDDTAKTWTSQAILICPGRRRLDSGREGMAGEYE